MQIHFTVNFAQVFLFCILREVYEKSFVLTVHLKGTKEGYLVDIESTQRRKDGQRMKKKSARKEIGELLSLTAIGIAMSALIFSFDANAQVPETEEDTEYSQEWDESEYIGECEDYDETEWDAEAEFAKISEWMRSKGDTKWN